VRARTLRIPAPVRQDHVKRDASILAPRPASVRPSLRLESRARWYLVALGSALALGSMLCPGLAPRLASAGIGAWVAAFGLGLSPATALFCAAGHAGSCALLGFGPRGDLDSYASFAEIGTGLATLALVLAWRRAAEPAPGPRWAGALGILLALAACFWSARRAGFEGDSARWLPILVAAPVSAFAMAGFFSETGVLRGRRCVQALTLVATLLALRFPDRCELAAAPAALGLALCAGDALEAAPRAARLLGAAAGLLFAALALVGNPPTPVAAAGEALDAQDELVRWRKTGELAYTVEVDARVPVADVALAFVSERDGLRVERPMQRSGDRFTHGPVRRAQLRDPAWSVQLELLGPAGAQVGQRVIDRLVLPQAPGLSPALLGFLLAALCLAFVRGGSARLAIAAALLTAAQAAWLYQRT